MAARYAIYDTRTDSDIGEFDDLVAAYAEIDRLRELHHGIVHGVRLAREHREVTDFQRKAQKLDPLGRWIEDDSTL